MQSQTSSLWLSAQGQGQLTRDLGLDRGLDRGMRKNVGWDVLRGLRWPRFLRTQQRTDLVCV
jgi:hypothetical protein